MPHTAHGQRRLELVQRGDSGRLHQMPQRRAGEDDGRGGGPHSGRARGHRARARRSANHRARRVNHCHRQGEGGGGGGVGPHLHRGHDVGSARGRAVRRPCDGTRDGRGHVHTPGRDVGARRRHNRHEHVAVDAAAVIPALTQRKRERGGHTVTSTRRKQRRRGGPRTTTSRAWWHPHTLQASCPHRPSSLATPPPSTARSCTRSPSCPAGNR